MGSSQLFRDKVASVENTRDSLDLIVDGERTDSRGETVLDLVPALFARTRREGVELTLRDGDNRERVALVRLGLGDKLKLVVQVTILILAFARRQHLGARARSGESLSDERVRNLLSRTDIRHGLTLRRVHVQRHALQRFDDILEHRRLSVDLHLLPPHRVQELVALARVLGHVHARDRRRRSRATQRVHTADRDGERLRQRLPSRRDRLDVILFRKRSRRRRRSASTARGVPSVRHRGRHRRRRRRRRHRHRSHAYRSERARRTLPSSRPIGAPIDGWMDE